MTWNERIEVITLKIDDRYWPAYEINRTENGWRRTPLPGNAIGKNEEPVNAGS
jgi:hypothetical protein